MTDVSTDASDLVELLRQRVQTARSGLVPTNFNAKSQRLYRALGHLDDELCAEYVDDPEMQAVARALLAPEGQTTTEWATYWGADSPEAAFHLLPLGPSGFVECEDREDAEELAKNHGAKVARRTVSRGPWQVVLGGEQQ